MVVQSSIILKLKETTRRVNQLNWFINEKMELLQPNTKSTIGYGNAYLAVALCVGAGQQWMENDNRFIQVPDEDPFQVRIWTGRRILSSTATSCTPRT